MPEWVASRLDLALQIQQTAGPQCLLVCLGAGTPHKQTILSPSGYALHEASACAAYLTRQGVDSSHILKESASTDTIGNGYFSLTSHAIPAGWR